MALHPTHCSLKGTESIPQNGHKRAHSLREVRQTHLLSLLCISILCILLSDGMRSNVVACKRGKIFCDNDGDKNQKQNNCVFTFWVFLTFPTLPSLCSMWLRVCSLIGRVVWDPVAACLEDWHNNTGSQHLSVREEDTADKSRAAQDFS